MQSAASERKRRRGWIARRHRRRGRQRWQRRQRRQRRLPRHDWRLGRLRWWLRRLRWLRRRSQHRSGHAQRWLQRGAEWSIAARAARDPPPGRHPSATMRKLALVLGSFAIGCGGVPSETENTEALQTAFANDQAAYDFFVARGLTNFQAAGIVGNLDQESGVNPNSVQYGGGPGRGIAQWSVGGRWDTSAHDNVQWYAGTKSESATSLNLQL